jgi:hypothetical protein
MRSLSVTCQYFVGTTELSQVIVWRSLTVPTPVCRAIEPLLGFSGLTGDELPEGPEPTAGVGRTNSLSDVSDTLRCPGERSVTHSWHFHLCGKS